VYRDLRKSSDNLLFRTQVRSLLELKVANGTRQCQVAVNSSKLYKATSSTDSGLLSCVRCQFAGILRG